jgi:HK97 gp10 family phage protein
MALEIENIGGILERLDGIADETKMKQSITKACMLLERAAKQNAQGLSEGDGTLAGSISSRIDDLSGVVYTPLFYAPYVEYGTGIEAEGGKGRQDVPWVYVEHSGNEGGSQRSYTEQEARQTVAMLREKGLAAHMTYGQKPQPFMRPALDDNRQKIVEILKGGLL